MRTNKLVIGLLIVAAISLVSCGRFGADVETSSVSISISPQNPKVGEEVTVTINTDAQYPTLFTGDEDKRFKRSRVRAIIEHDWDSFYEECYRVSYTKNGEKALFYKYFKDYQSIEGMKRDFKFFGAIDNIRLVPYRKGDFPGALMEMSYIGTNQLKFTATDRHIPSSIRVKPDIHIFEELANQPGDTIIESRFVAYDADRAIRKYFNDAWVAAYFGLYTEQLEDSGGCSTEYKYYAMQDERSYGAFQTNDPLSRRPTEGLYKLGGIYNRNTYLQPFLDYGEKIILHQVNMYINDRSTFATVDDSPYRHDPGGDGILEVYECELDPAIGLPVHKTDYTKYKGFQGDVYLSFIEMGTDEYEPWGASVLLGSVYTTGEIQKTYEYVYTGAGDFTITAATTNVGGKDYKGIGCSEERSNSLDDYSHKRAFSSVEISMQP